MSNEKYKIVKEIGSLSENGKWNIKLNLVSWFDNKPKYDLRPWSPDNKKMGKGVTFTEEELISLKEILNSIDLE